MRTTIDNFRVSVPLESLVKRLTCSFCGNSECKVVGRLENELTIQLVECGSCALVSTAWRLRRCSTIETSSTATTYVSHLPHSAARRETVLLKGDATATG